MSFMDLLNETLPSKKRSSGYMTESFIDDEDILLESILDEMFQDGDPQSDPDMPDDGEERDKSMKNEGCRREGCGEEGCRSEGCGEEGCRGGYCEGDDEDDDEEEDEFDIGMFGGDDDEEDEDDDDEDEDEFDIGDLSDEDLSSLEDDIEDDTISRIVGPEDVQKLTPDEEREADDMMSVAATTAVIKDELNAQERASFVESEREVQIAVNEGFLMESDINDMAEELGLMTEGKNYNKKMIVRLDKNAKMKQLYALGVNVSAAAHNDPDYKKLKKVNRIRKTLRKKLQKKYHSEALKRMKVYFKRLTQSKSKTLASLGKKFTK